MMQDDTFCRNNLLSFIEDNHFVSKLAVLTQYTCAV